MSVSSPCIDYCMLGENKICQGCFRSLDEIAAWSQLSDEAKLKVLEKTAERARQEGSHLARADRSRPDEQL